MTPVPKWCLLAALAVPAVAVSPALAAHIAWGDPVLDSHWPAIRFVDANGANVELVVHRPTLDETPEGQTVDLYTRVPTALQNGVPAYQARLAGYKGVVGAAGGSGRPLTITAPPTALSIAQTIAPASSPGGKIVMLFPKEGRAEAPRTPFPELPKPIFYLTLTPLEPEAANAGAIDRFNRRFLPMELGLGCFDVAGTLDGIRLDTIMQDPALKAASSGDLDALTAAVKDRRRKVLDKAQELHAAIRQGERDRKLYFNKAESELLWALVGQAKQNAAFTNLVAAAASDDGKRAQFVRTFRQLLTSELVRYKEAAQPLLDGSRSVEKEFNASLAGMNDRVAKTIAGDTAQLEDSAMTATHGCSSDTCEQRPAPNQAQTRPQAPPKLSESEERLKKLLGGK